LGKTRTDGAVCRSMNPANSLDKHAAQIAAAPSLARTEHNQSMSRQCGIQGSKSPVRSQELRPQRLLESARRNQVDWHRARSRPVRVTLSSRAAVFCPADCDSIEPGSTHRGRQKVPKM